MGVELSGPAPARTPLQQARQTALIERVRTGLDGRSHARREPAVRQNERDGHGKKHVDVSGKRVPSRDANDPDEGEDGAEGEQHSG
jgi:hypothetical protein